MNLKKFSLLIASSSAILILLALAINSKVVTEEHHCATCESHKKTTKEVFTFFSFRADSENETFNISDSQFTTDFPNFDCQHHWSASVIDETYQWESPLYKIFEPDTSSKEFPTLIVECYHKSSAFRKKLHDMLDSGEISEPLIFTMANSHCMDRGICQLDLSLESHQKLLNLILVTKTAL